MTYNPECAICKLGAGCAAHDPEATQEGGPVHHPWYYNTGDIEIIDAIEDWELGFHLGNAVKYIARAPHKSGEQVERDIRKAIWYLQRFLGENKKE